MTETYDVIVVGAGIVGCACAEQCARDGLNVLLVDRSLIGGETTAAGMGHIVVLDDSESQFDLCRYSSRLWSDLADEVGKELEWERRGTLWVAADEEEMEIVQSRHDFYRSRDVRVEILDAPLLARAEPHLRDGLRGGLLVNDDAVLYPPAAAKWLADRAAEQGATIREYTEVKAIDPDGSIVLSDETRISGGIVINAAGCRAPELSEGYHVFKRKGHLVVTNRYPNLVRHQVIELGYLKSAHTMTSDSVAFNIQPRKDGKLLIGSSRQSDAEDTGIDIEILGRMLRRAMEYVPSLRNLGALRTWSGFRPATPDKLPLLGPCPGSERVWLAAGHEGLGITTSLASARLIADRILERDSEIPIDPYLPSRCSIGETLNG